MRSVPLILAICAVLWAGFAMVRKAVRPLALYARERSEVSQIERELKQVKEDNIDLKRQTDYLKSPEGAQTEARKLGYVKPGEVSIMLETAPKKQDR